MNRDAIVPINHRLRILEILVEQSNEVVFWTDESGRILGCNKKMCERFGYEREELLKMCVADIDSAITPSSHQLLLKQLEKHETVSAQNELRSKDGILFAMNFDVHRIVIEDTVYLLTYGHELHWEKQLRDCVLLATASETPLNQVLSLIVELAEEARPGMIAFVALDDGTGKFRVTANQGLSQALIETVEGVGAVETVGMLRESLEKEVTVVIEDVHRSPLCASLVNEFSSMGVQTCWTEPIVSSDHQVRGVIVMLFREPTDATSYSRELLQMIARAVSEAIVKSRGNEFRRKNEIRFRSLAETTSEAIWTASPDGMFVAEQKSWEQFTGQPWESHQGLGWSNMVHEFDRDRIVAFWMGSLDQFKTVDLEGRVWHNKRKTFRYINFKAAPILHDGKVVEWIGKLVDIHDRKVAEEKFTKSQFILSQSQAVAGLGSWIWDFRSNRVQWSEEFSRLHGLKLDQREGDFNTLLEHCISADRPKLRKALQKTLESGEPRIVQYQISGPNGALRTVVSKTKFELNSAGRRCGLFGIVHDVTDAKQTEIDLQKSERQLRMITDSVPVMIAYVDLEYRYQFNNALYELNFNMSRQEMKGRHVSEFVGKDVFAIAKPNLDRAFRGLPTSFEQKLVFAKGVYQTLDIRMVPDFDLDKRVVGAFVLLLDITERRNLEREILDVATDQQSRIGQDLHDGTGQELTGIGMVADALLHKLTRRDAEEAEIAGKLCRGIKRALQQVRSVARGLNPVDVSPQGLVSGLTEMARSVEDLYGVNCQLICQANLNIPDNLLANQLFRIAQEATTNACKHSGATEVVIQFTGDQKEVVLSVSDNGCGIKDIDHLFKEQNKGMGLRSIQYRARMIDAALSFSNRETGGTHVSCHVIFDPQEFNRENEQASASSETQFKET